MVQKLAPLPHHIRGSHGVGHRPILCGQKVADEAGVGQVFVELAGQGVGDRGIGHPQELPIGHTKLRLPAVIAPAVDGPGLEARSEFPEADGDLVAEMPLKVKVVPEEAAADHACVGQVEPAVPEPEGQALDVLDEGRGDVKKEVPACGCASGLVGDEVGDGVAGASPQERRAGEGADVAFRVGAVAAEAAAAADGQLGGPEITTAKGDKGSGFAPGANRSGQERACQNGKAGEEERRLEASSGSEHAPRLEAPRVAGESVRHSQEFLPGRLLREALHHPPGLQR